MFDGEVLDLPALRAININNPLYNRSVDLTLLPNFSIRVASPGNNSPSAWFYLKNEPSITVDIFNWAVIAGARKGSEVWIREGNIIASDNTAPNFTPPTNYAGLTWTSKFFDSFENRFSWDETWVFDGFEWKYQPTVVPTAGDNPNGQGSLVYEGGNIYIANFDLSGWTLLTTTEGSTEYWYEHWYG